MSNSVDPDETAQYCLQKPIIIDFGSERVNFTFKFTLTFTFVFLLEVIIWEPFKLGN